MELLTHDDAMKALYALTATRKKAQAWKRAAKDWRKVAKAHPQGDALAHAHIYLARELAKKDAQIARLKAKCREA